MLRVVNRPTPAYFTVGALAFLGLVGRPGVAVWAALPLAALAAGAVAVPLDWLLLARLRHHRAPEPGQA